MLVAYMNVHKASDMILRSLHKNNCQSLQGSRFLTINVPKVLLSTTKAEYIVSCYRNLGGDFVDETII